jgi:hypothetical protein
MIYINREGAFYTVNMMGSGFLQEQVLVNNLEQAKTILFEYFKDHNEEFVEDGYVVITEFSDFDTKMDVIFNVLMEDEINEVREYLNIKD